MTAEADPNQKHELFWVIQNIVLVNHENHVLILRHPSGNWLLPGGKINRGENWQQGLKRELKEEAGIQDFTIGRILSVDSWRDEVRAYYGVTFIGSISTLPVITLSEEHDRFLWVGPDDLESIKFWHQSIPYRIKQYYLELQSRK